MSVSVSIYVGTHTALQSIQRTASELYHTQHLSDFQINFIPTTEDELPLLQDQIQGISKLDKRLILPGSIETKEDLLVASLLIFLDRHGTREVNQLKIMEGGYFPSEDEEAVLLDYSFARDYGYHVGDHITLGIQGFFSEFEIVGLVINPEMLISSANPELYIPVKGSLGVVYVPMEVIQNLFGYSIYNNISVIFGTGANSQEVTQHVERQLVDSNIEVDSEFFQDDLYSVVVIKRQMKTFYLIVPFIVTIFHGVAFFILFFSVHRMIQQDMPQIGTLIALGFSRWQIASAYLIAGVVLGSIGYILGCLQSVVLANDICKEYISGTGFPFVNRYYSLAPFAKAFIQSIGFSLAATGIPLRKIFTMNAAAMIEGIETTKVYVPSFRISSGILQLERLWNHFLEGHVLLKSALRNIWRRKFFFMFSTGCIILILSFSISLLITDTSIYHAFDEFLKFGKWDIFVSFIGQILGPDAESLGEIEGVSDFELYRKGFVTLNASDQEIPYRIVGVPFTSELMKPDMLQGRFFLSDDAQEIVLTKRITDQFHLSLGAPVFIKSNDSKLKLTLVGIMDSFMLGQAFIPLRTIQKLFPEEPGFSGAILAISGEMEQIEEQLHHIENMGYIIQKEQVRETLYVSMGKLSYFWYLYCEISVVVAVLIIFITLYLNILDRETEYAVLLANGFGKWEIGHMIVYEVLVMILIMVFATIPLSMFFANLNCTRMTQSVIHIRLYLRAGDFLKILVPGVLFMLAAAAYCIKTAVNVNIVNAIRNRILG